MKSIKDRLRAFFADSTASGRMKAILAAVGLGLLLVVLLTFVYRWACPWRSRAENSVCSAFVKNPPWALLTSLAAAPALILTWWWRTVHKDLDIAQAKSEERSRRFVDAIQLLSSENLESQLGAIYSLESLAQESGQDRGRVASTLCAYIRVHGQPRQQKSSEPEQPSAIKVDFIEPVRNGQPPAIQAAFSVVAQLDWGEHWLDLRRAQLFGIELNAGFASKINLIDANLGGAQFGNANLIHANLIHANLTNAYLHNANLSFANLSGANLSFANLCNADLSFADLSTANLSTAGLCTANLSLANLSQANFSYADLSYANLGNANLSGANLSGANLIDANLSDANLNNANLNDANYSTKTTFPSNFDAMAAGAILHTRQNRLIPEDRSSNEVINS